MVLSAVFRAGPFFEGLIKGQISRPISARMNLNVMSPSRIGKNAKNAGKKYTVCK
jgi:hypothetical protein